MNKVDKNTIWSRIEVLNRIEIGNSAELVCFNEKGEPTIVETEDVIDYSLKPKSFTLYTKDGDYKTNTYEFIKGLPKNRYKYVINDENVGYKIESRIYADDGINYVLAYNENNRYGSNFVTWIENVYSGEPKYDGGHYFDTREEAMKDLLLRVDSNKSIGLKSHFMKEIFKEDLQSILSMNYEDDIVQQYMDNPEFVDIVFDEWLSIDSAFIDEGELLKIVQDQIDELDQQSLDQIIEL